MLLMVYERFIRLTKMRTYLFVFYCEKLFFITKLKKKKQDQCLTLKFTALLNNYYLIVTLLTAF